MQIFPVFTRVVLSVKTIIISAAENCSPTADVINRVSILSRQQRRSSNSDNIRDNQRSSDTSWWYKSVFSRNVIVNLVRRETEIICCFVSYIGEVSFIRLWYRRPRETYSTLSSNIRKLNINNSVEQRIYERPRVGKSGLTRAYNVAKLTLRRDTLRGCLFWFVSINGTSGVVTATMRKHVCPAVAVVLLQRSIARAELCWRSPRFLTIIQFLVSPVDSDPGIVEDRRSQQHALIVVKVQ